LVELLPRLRRLARALTRDPADADDLAQLTLLRALERQSQWRPDTRLDSWMFRIMKNAWIDETRSRGRWGKVLEAPEAGERAADPAPDSAEALAVRQAMTRIPDEQRLAVALVLVEGLSYAEAAEVLEVPVGTLTSRLARGRAALQAELEGSAA
jgi:RNA polymerase sigma-70 factor (ECF subfamily)